MIAVIVLGVVCFIVGWLAKSYQVERADEFYEDDEPIEDVQAAFDRGEKRTT